jgi:hypothetical protein
MTLKIVSFAAPFKPSIQVMANRRNLHSGAMAQL